ncbi:siderophore-interacting protein [Frankia sp. Cpl3]|uniref:hypothetical protein n=1 Tax=Parafrankia colletiae TaxID=573497 RepID=UPI00104259A5|nr:hypothetical protein [Parafrankia colletiae]MCK9905098.1 siderophore-interacting protein [Frankia sp. Cpl3]
MVVAVCRAPEQADHRQDDQQPGESGQQPASGRLHDHRERVDPGERLDPPGQVGERHQPGGQERQDEQQRQDDEPDRRPRARRHLLAERGLPREHVSFCGYWGRSD